MIKEFFIKMAKLEKVSLIKLRIINERKNQQYALKN
ncbi:MAG: hypothetical protein ACJA0S_001090 [Rickettsiales bacterium]|jgi:hypothetical protein